MLSMKHVIKPLKCFALHFVAFIFIFPSAIFAIHPTVRNFNRKVSNAGTQNWDIIQVANDWMYFANNKGLLEFDGNKWIIYPIPNYTNVRSLYYDEKEDRIYAGAFNEFGYYGRNDIGELKYVSLMNLIKPEERNFAEIWHINKIDNTIYFQGDKEVFRYKDDKIHRFNFKTKIDFSAEIQNSLIVTSSTGGISYLNGNLFMKFPNSDIMAGKKVCAILPYGEDKILFVTDFHGIFVFNGETVEKFTTDIDNFLTENQVFSATIKDSKLALGTVRNGLVVKDLKTNSNTFSNTFSGLQNNTVLSVAFDSQDNLWLGLDKGIDYVQINSPIYDLFGNSQLFGAGYTSLINGNTLYLGTNQGLYVTQYPLASSPDPMTVNIIPRMQGQVWSLTQIDNTIFCGSDHGTYIISGEKAEKIQGIPGTWGLKKLARHPDCIIGSSYHGFFILKKTNDKWELSNFVKGFEESGGMFEEDESGHIWFSHWVKGISRLTLNEGLDSFVAVEHFDTSKGFPSNRDNTLYKIQGKLVFSTQGGFYNYAGEKRIERSTELTRLFGTPTHSMQLKETPWGDIWCTSYTYIGVALKQNGKGYRVDSLSFSPLKSKLINGFEHFNFIDRNNIIVSTEDGYSWLDISKISNKKSASKIYIRNIYLTNEGDSLVRGFDFTPEKDVREFNFRYNSIRFEYVTPEYRNEGLVTYSYKLENHDTKWSAFSPANIKEYTKLKKGTYTFRVRAKNPLEPGISETSYQFTILPPWYLSNLAYFFYFVVFVLLILKTLHIIKIRSDKGAREMEARKELELMEQEKRFEADAKEKRKEIIELKNQRLQYDLRHKSQELANSTMNLIRKNEILLEINQNLTKLADDIHEKPEPGMVVKKIHKMQDEIRKNIEHDNNWKRFAENFDLVYENYLKRLSEAYPQLTISDKKLCAYLKMDLSSKDIAPLLNMSFRSVEMSRYRLRKKMGLDREVNLGEFLQRF